MHNSPFVDTEKYVDGGPFRQMLTTPYGEIGDNPAYVERGPTQIDHALTKLGQRKNGAGLKKPDEGETGGLHFPPGADGEMSRRTFEARRSTDKRNSKGSMLESMNIGPELFVALKKGDIKNSYNIGKVIGEGAYGKVCMTTHKTTSTSFGVSFEEC